MENISLADLEILIIECYKKYSECKKHYGKNSKKVKKYDDKLYELQTEFDNRINILLKL